MKKYLLLLVILIFPSFASALNHTNAYWKKMNSGTTSQLNDVWVSSSGKAFVAGNSGTILKYENGAWSSMTIGTSQNLTGIWGRSDSDVFAVGSNGSQFHYDGNSWSSSSAYPSPGSGIITKVYGNNNNAYCSKLDGKVQRYTSPGFWFDFDDTNIVINLDMLLELVCTPTSLNGIYVSPDNKVYACGYAEITQIEYKIDPQGNRVYKDSANIGVKPTILWHDGTKWNFRSFLKEAVTVNGYSFNDLDYFSFTGANSEIQGFYNVWGNGNTVYIVGSSKNTSNNVLQGCYITFQNGIITESNVIDGILHVNDSWGTASDNLFFAASLGVIFYKNANQIFSGITETNEHIYSIFGRSETDIFAVGPNGTILHYDGTGQPALNLPANASTQTSSTVSFTWSPYPESQEFWLQIATDPHFSNKVYDNSVGNNNSINISGFPNTGVRYYWRIKARNTVGWSIYSNAKNFVSGQSIPVLNSPVNASFTGGTIISFAWNQVPNATRYILQISTNSSFSNLVLNSYVNSNQISLSNFPNNGAEFYWRVVPVYSSGTGQYWSAFSYFINKNP